MVNTTKIGDELEAAFHHYLLDQQKRGEFVYGTYSPELCRIYRKKGYFSAERGSDVVFDVVIELFRFGATAPHSYIVFECKNHKTNISDLRVREFSDKLSDLFRHSAKGILVITSKLQSGAESIATKRGMGIVKYDRYGLDIIAERRSNCVEKNSLRSQMLNNGQRARSLKFSAMLDSKYFAGIDELIAHLDPRDGDRLPGSSEKKLPFLSTAQIRSEAGRILELVNYQTGAVDLPSVCKSLDIDLKFTDHSAVDCDGAPILGTANFVHRLIEVNATNLDTRDRFTIGHELGHFVLGHEAFLRSESVIERDLKVSERSIDENSHMRLEYQANIFANELVIPHNQFLLRLDELRTELDFRDKGFGYIYVDDQPCNFVPFNALLSQLSTHFHVSKRAIEVKLARLQMLSDQRKAETMHTLGESLSNLIR